MQHLEVSGAVRPLKWSLGVKWLNEIFSPSNKIHREVGWAKDLSAPPYMHVFFFVLPEQK